MNNEKKALGIYIHIPFCISKCVYCDFLSFPATDMARENYVQALIEEIWACELDVSKYVVKTMFIGGGTPSILSPEQLQRIMVAIYEKFEIDENPEISMECNPGTITKEKLLGYKNCGINRISIGLQSTFNEELKALGRIHTYEEFLEGYRLAREVGFDNINIDIMSGLMNQSVESYRETLRRIVELNPEHISAYSLIVEDGTPLKTQLERLSDSNINPLPNEEEEREMYYETKRILSQNGYKRYEISNYAKPGFLCRHNLSYWNRVDYIGFGIGSASLIDEIRFNNVDDMNIYMDLANSGRSCHIEEEELSKEESMSEFMFLGLRKMEGVSKIGFEKAFGVTLDEVYGDVNIRYMDLEMLEESDGNIRLTEKGIDVSNVIMAEYL